MKHSTNNRILNDFERALAMIEQKEPSEANRLDVVCGACGGVFDAGLSDVITRCAGSIRGYFVPCWNRHCCYENEIGTRDYYRLLGEPGED